MLDMGLGLKHGFEFKKIIESDSAVEEMELRFQVYKELERWVMLASEFDENMEKMSLLLMNWQN